jgi:hypothetical protein
MNTENGKPVEFNKEFPEKKKSLDKRHIEEQLRAIKGMRIAFG